MSASGGCQCGAVRFRVEGELGEASICHCRMCQKATGGFFGPYVGTSAGTLVWTRGAPRRFQSSNKVVRGFCGDCGTPLTYEYGDKEIGLAIGALDAPAAAAPSVQLESRAELPYFAQLADLPVHAMDEPRAAAHLAGIVSFQHPDHDTTEWPPKTS
ncbi:MAG: aldehyde-activating protein [Phenylobacterium sp.]|uniref:GFA family protein n=1 Tax=Phenylobacterium sp. TaxID=1871053 RepID=UPI0025FDBAD4|nr:GFA family protein [Phenylobacterium sp.]MBA4011418.1 aldehyde-activating protein [Phenylobacterium sp.]